MKAQRLVPIGLVAALAAGCLVACGKKTASSNDPATPSTTTVGSGGGGDTAADSLLSAYPSQLALAIFTGAEGAELRLVGDDKLAQEAAAKPIKDRAEEEEKLVKGEADSCFPAALERNAPGDGTETCYEFDQDMLVGARGQTLGTPIGTKNGKNAAGEACLVAFAKDRSSAINDLLEKAKGMVAAMMCQAKKVDPSAALPAAAGESLDLKEILAAAFGAKADKIEVAKIERLADKDEQPVYRSVVKMDIGQASRTVVMVHSPAADGAYQGSLYAVTSLGKLDKQLVLSIVYAKVKQDDGSFRLRAELRRAGVQGDLVASVIDDAGQLDFNVGRDFSVAANDPNYGKRKKASGGYYNNNEDMAGQTRIIFEIDPDSDAGSFAYWQNPGSNYGEAARGMVANVTVENGAKKGCAVSGAALGKTNLMEAYSIAKALKDGKDLEPVGFYHPFYNIPTGPTGGDSCTVSSNPGSDADGTFYAMSCGTEQRKWYEPKVSDAQLATTFAKNQAGGIVTRQCYVFDDETGLYDVDSSEITQAAGYELVSNTDTSKLVAAPKIDDDVKPFEGVVKEK